MALAPRPRLRLIHNLARTGSTVFCKCIGSMAGVALLSEIHPRGAAIFNPLDQAQAWYGLFSAAEIRAIAGRKLAFPEAIGLIDRKFRQRNRALVLRDWAHIDFHAAPFAPWPTFRLSLRDALEPGFDLLSLFTVRHPVDTWLSLSALDIMRQPMAENRFTIETFLVGYVRFARLARNAVFTRYEDFVADPDSALERACRCLELRYDSRYRDNWKAYTQITGDVAGTRSRNEIVRLDQRRIDIVTMSKFDNDPHYHESLTLLGY